MKDKVVVITGGSKGLGKELAKVFIRENSKVIITSRTERELNDVAKAIGATAYVADVTSEDQVLKLAQKVVKGFGQIDLWINNAGIWLPHASIEKTDWKRVHQMLEVNLFGTVYGSKAALINKVKMIVNILTTSALSGRPYSSGYCASKYATLGFTNSLREEAKDVKVISVFPGGMKTHFFDENKPNDFGDFMDPVSVAEKIIANLKKESPDEELIIRRK